MVNYLDAWKNVITNPTAFFKDLPRSGGYGEPLKFAVISYLLGIIEIFVFLLLFEINTFNLIAGIKSTIVFSFLFLIAEVLGLFILSFIFLISFRIVGGKGGDEGTFRQVAYSSAPAALLIIPVLSLYSLYLLIVGGKYIHNISKIRSAIAVFIPAIVIGGIFLLFIVPLFAYNDFPETRLMVSVKVLSATPTSIELLHYGGDSLKLNQTEFTIKKANGEVLILSVFNANSSDSFKVGDTLRLYADFGNSGDKIRIIAKCTPSYCSTYEILDVPAQIK